MQDNFYNRINDRRRDTDTVKNIKVSIEDIDTAILGHIINIIKPTVNQNEEIIGVPILFADAEMWKSVQEYGYIRDGKSKQLMVPLIVLKNTGVEKNTNIPVDKLDGSIKKVVKSQWNKKESFNVINTVGNNKISTEYYSVTIPDYIIVSYELVIWTGYISHMNSIVEKFIYAENSYWGTGNLKFRTSYTNIPKTVEITDGKDRLVKSNIDMNVHGYILPESFNSENTTIKRLTPSKVIIRAEFDTESENIMRRSSISTRVDDADTLERV